MYKKSLTLQNWSYRHPGCKNICMHERHMHINQIWRFRNDNPGKRVLFCRECEYCTLSNSKRCYCCGTPMAFAYAKESESRKLYNEKKMRY